MSRKFVIVILVLIVALLCFLGLMFEKKEPVSLKVLVLYNSGTDSYYDTYQHLNQTLLVDTAINLLPWPQTSEKLQAYDAVYLDRGLAEASADTALAERMKRYVKDGGMLFAENEWYRALPKELIGAQDFVELERLPERLVYPEPGMDAKGLQTVIKQFHQDVSGLYNKERLEQMPLGMGVVPSTAVSLASTEDGIALYALNRYGKGLVFFCNGLLPNSRYITGFDMQQRDAQEQSYFNFMFATGSYQLRNEFLSFLSKEKLGYSVQKVLGTNGRPAIAWQNHFEAVASIQNEGMEKWIDYLKDYDQIPSFSLVRETYDWGIWKEGLAYYSNIGSPGKSLFEGENVNSQYSSGTIVLHDSGEAFSMEHYPEYKNLSGELSMPYRTYADAADMNNDGVLDMIAGSGGGAMSIYPGVLRDGTWMLGEAEQPLLADGSMLHTGGFAAPVFADLNGDPQLDLIIGGEDGRVRAFVQEGDLRFREIPELVPIGIAGAYSAPDVADLDGDGIADLIIGTEDGQLIWFKGRLAGGLLKFAPAGTVLRESSGQKDDRFAAPRIADLDGSGSNLLLVGGNGGYLKKYRIIASHAGDVSLEDEGYVEGQAYNPFGDFRLWGGRNSVPVVGDVNHDGLTDLIVGQMIFGFPIAIDDPGFPYRKELERSLAYAKQHYIDIQPHLFFHSYESAAREAEEIELHRQAFQSYGLPWKPAGTNQHTWRMNNLDTVQSILSEKEAGIWWNSGFRPPSNPYEPSLSGEYAWTMPFLLANKEKVEPFIVYNPAPNLPIFADAYDSYAALDMPITHFYHMEYAILEPESKSSYAPKVQFLDQFRDEHDYNFMTEEQMFRSIMAAYQADSTIETPILRGLWDRISNRIRTKQQMRLTIHTKGDRELNWMSQPDSNLQEAISDYRAAVGYKVELGSRYKGYIPVADSPIAMYRGSTLYVGGSTEVEISLGQDVPKGPRIERMNQPAKVDRDGSNARIQWLGQGLQQIKLYAPNGLEVHSEGWKTEASVDKKRYVLTRYGGATTLEVTFQ